MTPETMAGNRSYNRLGIGLSRLMTVMVGAILIGILVFLVIKGYKHLSPGFFLHNPIDLGREGGIFPVLVSTVLLALTSLCIAVPFALTTAVFLTEYTRESWLTTVIRFGAECLAGIPSIIFGLFGFMLFVVAMGMGWSILSGGLTLACMVLPTIIRTSEEAIKAVPGGLRQVGYSLGATKSQVI
ncbi:MAG TPA: ABC transporter permease subunit, partial [Candidatus Rifleibacterium sp.]|nr:ABC transporter permease subunit [Candidatus Rifleibacterium sp.]